MLIVLFEMTTSRLMILPLLALLKKPPSLYWAYYTLAKLGRWHDRKRTGIVGWEALWDGCFVLNPLLEGTRFM